MRNKNLLFLLAVIAVIVCGCGSDAPVVPVPASSESETPERTDPRADFGVHDRDDPDDQPPLIIDEETGTILPGTTEDGACLSDEQLFVDYVWTPVLSTNCIVCHNELGDAKDTAFVLRDAYSAGFLEYDLELLRELAAYEKDGEPLLLLKPLGYDEHGGGIRLTEDDPGYLALKALLHRFANPTECDDVDEQSAVFEDVVLTDAAATLRKARLALTGSVPTPDELAAVEDIGAAALLEQLEAMMQEEAFYDRVREWFNDVLLTDAYTGGDAAMKLLSKKDFPSRDWYQNCNSATYVECLTPEFADLAATMTSFSVAREPLELIVYVLRHGLPFTEVLTADYMVVNPLTAKTYGVEMSFDDPLNLDEWKPAAVHVQRDGEPVPVPHAGLLTSPMFLNRYPTTDTNVNRHRAATVYRTFLATEVLKLAERPLDQATVATHNPTMNDASCSICHATLDPVAGAFQNWTAKGRYLPPTEGWNQFMRPPGFGSDVIPAEDNAASLAWLAERISGDQRFLTSMAHLVYRMLTGQEPLGPPTDPLDPDYVLKLSVFLQQHEYFRTIGQAFADDGYELRTIIRAIVLSPWFRAENRVEDPQATDQASLEVLAEIGMGRLLTPEQLGRRIEAATGTPWTDPISGDEPLKTELRQYYGGIDSKFLTTRATHLDSMMANVAERMANEVACQALEDFAKPAEERRLFPYVEWDYAPEEEHGYEVPALAAAIEDNVRYLHEHLLGERLAPGDPELERTIGLWNTVWEAGQLGIETGAFDAALPSPCVVDGVLESDPGYTLRAWMAVLSYLLADYRFLYE